MATTKKKKRTLRDRKPKQWGWFIGVTILYLAFLYWVKSWWGLLVVPFIFDAYITHYINWGWWKDEDGFTKAVMSWVDAIVFALVAVYFVNLFFFQNYAIPSSSLEKSLLRGDYLFVSKLSYGPRIPNTPLTMPLTQHTMPMTGTKSYITWPQWDYRRVKGFGKVQLNDIVVFNYPSGDSIIVNPAYQAADYYGLVYTYGRQLMPDSNVPDSLPVLEQRKLFEKIYEKGRNYIVENAHEFEGIDWRPVDRRENYVKRCVGLPGQTLEIKDRIIYLDGKPNKEPDNVQYNYIVDTSQDIPEEFAHSIGISDDDLGRPDKGRYVMPLTQAAKETLLAHKEMVTNIQLYPQTDDTQLFPLNGNKHWTCDNYGPIWIPAKGQSIDLTLENLCLYERAIKNYEKNDLEVRNGKIFINGKEATSYTFKMDYYWMMGDNRHNSADSRYWGYVPEDHIVGKPIVVWLSLDKDRSLFNGGIRWNRLFLWVDNVK